MTLDVETQLKPAAVVVSMTLGIPLEALPVVELKNLGLLTPVPPGERQQARADLASAVYRAFRAAEPIQRLALECWAMEVIQASALLALEEGVLRRVPQG